MKEWIVVWGKLEGDKYEGVEGTYTHEVTAYMMSKKLNSLNRDKDYVFWVEETR